MGPAGCVALLTLLVAAVAGCAPAVHTHVPGKVSICGKTVNTGAGQPVPARLQPDSPSRPTPSKPLLPPPAETSDSAGLHYIVLTSSCTTGALVTVEPPANAELAVTFPAADGRPAALGLVVTGPIVIRAWSDGHDLGSISQD